MTYIRLHRLWISVVTLTVLSGAYSPGVFSGVTSLAANAPANSPTTGPATRPNSIPIWLVGTWTSTNPRGRTEETWVPEGTALVGSGKTFRGDKLVFTESLRVDRNPTGQLIYTATPQGQAPTPFTASDESATTLVFENPNNDFPTKITYTLNPDGKLVAQISGVRNGKVASQTWTFTKSP